jgi:hypothetical protein
MDGTILGQGTFTATYSGANPHTGNIATQAANPVIIQVPSGVDWISVRNFTQSGTVGNSAAYFQGSGTANVGVEYYWQLGMAPGTAMVKYYGNTTAVVSGDTLLSGGFTMYDPSGNNPNALPLLGNAVATTASTNATNPVVSTASTAGLSVGSIVRISGTAQTDVNGIDMVVGAVTTNTSFQLLTSTNALATAPGVVGGAGFYRIVNYSPLFYPRRRYVVNIVAATGQVSTSIPHGLTPGQTVRFEIPAVSGMIQLNPTPTNNYLSPIITSVVDDYNFIINTNTTAFTAFTWPTTIPLQTPVSFPSVTPVGEDTATALVTTGSQVPSIGGQQIFNTNTGILADSTVNTGFLGMILGSGGLGKILATTYITGPAGTVTFSAANAITSQDVMYWLAGKSTYGGQ